MRAGPLLLLSLWGGLAGAGACELCSVYNAANARGEFTGGALLTVAELFIPSRTVQLNGREIESPFLSRAYLDTSITHLVPGYNFTPRFGINASVPIIHRSFKFFEFSPTGLVSEEGSESGVGDVSLVSRVTLIQKLTMKNSAKLDLLLGIKFPTGDDDRLGREIESARRYNALFPSGHIHDVLPPVSGVHQHDLALGSGSFDGLAGVTSNFRHDRFYFNAQFQYYLRTEAGGFRFGDELMISGGPGVFLILGEQFTLSAELLASYETSGKDELLGRKDSHTGMSSWYAGPQIRLSAWRNLSFQAGADLPLAIDNNGLQNVPDYRIHGGITWRF